jgi:hypothetical protein
MIVPPSPQLPLMSKAVDVREHVVLAIPHPAPFIVASTEVVAPMSRARAIPCQC